MSFGLKSLWLRCGSPTFQIGRAIILLPQCFQDLKCAMYPIAGRPTTFSVRPSEILYRNTLTG